MALPISMSGVIAGVRPRTARSVAAALAIAAMAAFTGLGPARGAFPPDPNDPSYNTCAETAPHLPGNPATNPACSFLSEQWQLYSFFPRNTPLANAAGNQNVPPLPGSGLSADTAWLTTTGSNAVVIAIIDSGIIWNDRDLTDKVFLNRNELPLPLGPQCVAAPGTYDCNADGVFNVEDYNGDVRVIDANGNTFIDPEDVIVAFSDGTDADSNGYKDDIAGWDTFRNDNDAFDEVDFGHGTGRAKDAGASTNNGIGGASVCPNCLILPVRAGDSFLVSSSTFSQGVVFAVDSAASIVEAAVGAVGEDAFMQQALDYAWNHGVLSVIASADEDSFHHSPPSSLNHALSVKAVIPNTAGSQGGGTSLAAQTATTSFLSHAACTNFGGHIHVAIPTDSCSSGATSHAAGVAGLVYSRARQIALSPPLSADEAKQIITMSADDINIPGSGTSDLTKYPSHPGWDQYFGYGRINALKAAQKVAAATIPPQADIISPKWFDILDPAGGPNIPITGLVSAPRAPSYSYVVQCAVGVEPTDAQFGANVVASASGLVAPIQGTLATWQPSSQCTPPNVTGTPSQPDDFTVTLRVRVTDSFGNAGEDRKTVAVHHDASLSPGFPVDTGVSGESSIALVDIDQDNKLDIVEAGSDGRVYVFEENGNPMAGFPVSADPVPAFDSANAANHLASAGYLSGQVIPSPDNFTASVAVGDMFHDGRQEIFAGGYGGKLYAWFNDSTRVPGFPVSMDPSFSANPSSSFEPVRAFVSSPALGDIDPSTPDLEVVIGGLDQHLYAWHSDGTPVAGFPVLLNSPNPTTFAADDCGENKIVSSPAIGDVDHDGLLDIVIGTNEAFADSNNCGDQLFGSGRAYVVSNTGVVKTVLQPHSRIKPIILPGVATGIPTSPALADIDGDGKLEIAIATIGSQPDVDTIIFKYDGTPFHSLTSTFSNASSTDSPFLALLGNGAFGDVNGDGKVDYALGGTGTKLLLRFGFPGQRLDHDHLVGAWDPATGALISGFPRKMEDWQFLTDPTIANLGGAGRQVINGSGGYLLHAFGSGGSEPAGWPKFTNGWIIGAAAVGDLYDDGHPVVVENTREGKIFAWSTAGAGCSNDQWWRFHHDEYNTGLYGFDSRRPDGILNLTGDAAGLHFTAPGDDGRCGTAQQYLLRRSASPIYGALWSSAIPVGPVAAPQTAGSAETIPPPALPPGTYYFAIRAVDDAGNLGIISNSVPLTINAAPPAVAKIPEGNANNVNSAIPAANLWLCIAPAPCSGAGEGDLRVVEHAANVVTGDQNGDTLPDGLGAYEFSVEYDNFVIQSVNPCDIVFGPTGAGSTRGPVDELDTSAVNADCAPDPNGANNGTCSMSAILENIIHFGCTTSGPLPPGPDGSFDLASLDLIPHPDLQNDIFPGNNNGVVTVIKDNGCELVDVFGHAVLGSVNGGLTPVCGDLAVTVRILEGDLNLDCKVDAQDQQLIAYRYGSYFGIDLYSKWFDLEPALHDLDIDIKDLQKVFGRDGSTCQVPVPAQPPLPPPAPFGD